MPPAIERVSPKCNQRRATPRIWRALGAHVGPEGRVWWVVGNVVRDLGALNKREMLPWDHWGLAREARTGNGLTEAALASLDAVAALTAAADGHWTALREIYDREDTFRVPRIVMNSAKGVPVEVDLGV